MNATLTQHQNVLNAFSPLASDPHIHTAKRIAVENSRTNTLSWQQLINQCSGCKHTDEPDAIFAGFSQRKKTSLSAFKVVSIDGYMLTEEELFVGQLLATA